MLVLGDILKWNFAISTSSENILGLKVEKFEIRKGMRMHCVVRKPMGKAIGNER